MKKILPLAVAAVLGMTVSAQATVFINEVLGSTTSSDSEFIELYNSGPGSVDISGWTIELWDSDSGGSFGGSDGSSPYVIPAATSLPAGGYYLIAGPQFTTDFGILPDLSIANNAIENSSYTMILTDAATAPIDSIFVNDGGAGDAANRAGAAFAPGATVGPDGTFLPAGFYRVGDGGSSFGFLEFSPKPAASATPGAENLPEPASLALLAIGGLALIRRR